MTISILEYLEFDPFLEKSLPKLRYLLKARIIQQVNF